MEAVPAELLAQLRAAAVAQLGFCAWCVAGQCRHDQPACGPDRRGWPAAVSLVAGTGACAGCLPAALDRAGLGIAPRRGRHAPGHGPG
jgi:hypothetical protein